MSKSQLEAIYETLKRMSLDRAKIFLSTHGFFCPNSQIQYVINGNE